MRNLNKELKNRKLDYSKLKSYGFICEDSKNIYEKKIVNDDFKVVIIIDKNKVMSKVIEIDLNEEYLMVDIESATGDFVGRVKDQYDEIINDFINCCTKLDVFKKTQTKEIIKYIRDRYGDELEYLWPKFPNNAIWRNKENNKWYGLILTIDESKLGVDSDKQVEIIDLRYPKDKIDDIVDFKIIYPGYHMNKKSWITIILDNSLSSKKICSLIDESYNISLNGK